MEDNATLSRVHSLDPQALTVIHDRYFPVVYRYVRYRLDDEQLVEDITSEVFMRLLNTLHQKRKKIQNIQGWLLGTASNLVHDHLRLKYQRKVENLDEHENIPSSYSTEISAEDAFNRSHVRQAFQKLTADQQHVLALRFSQEFSLEETAQVMEKSVNAVKVLQFRALSSLRRLLEERF